MKAKILLILFGLAVGLISSEIVLSLINTTKAGSEFKDLHELRAAMLGDHSTSPSDEINRATMKNVVVPHPDDKIIYELKPKLEVTFAGAPMRTNSCGMRNPEASILKHPNTYRIALLGDSFAFGWGVNEKDNFAHVLENTLNKISHGQPTFEVLNFGVPGYSTFQEVYSFLEKGKDFNPDAILVFFIHNDFDFPFWVRSKATPWELFSGFRLANLIAKANPRIPQRQLVDQGLDPNSTLATLADVTKNNGVRLSVAVNPGKDWSHDVKRLKILQDREDIELLDINKGYREIVKRHEYKKEDLTLKNDPHPSVLGHQLYGELLAAYYLDSIN